MTCHQVLSACSRHSGTGERAATSQFCLHTADLWAYAKQKLLHLGELCGLLPGLTPTSEQLHLMVNLTSGMQEDMYLASAGQQRNPLERLKDSLSSNKAFQKNYLEMCEIAISSYKHIGRIRSARLIGRDLAAFYLELGEVQAAASFLTEGLKTFQAERWAELATRTMLDLAKCYTALGEREKYVRICAQIASSKAAGEEERQKYFDEMMSTLGALGGGESILVAGEEAVEFVSCCLERKNVEELVVPGARVTFSLVLTSSLPRPVSCSSLQLSLAREEPVAVAEAAAEKRTGVRRGPGLQRSPSGASSSSSTGPVSQGGEAEGEGGELEDGRLDIVEQLDYKQDKSLCAARLVCRNPDKVLRRKDSSGSILKEVGQVRRGDYTVSIGTDEVEVMPGTHTYRVHTVAGEEGKYELRQLSLRLQQLDFLTELPPHKSPFTVTSMRPAVALIRTGEELYAGLENKMVLSVHTGSFGVEEGTLVHLSCSRGMQVHSTQLWQVVQ